MNRITGGPGDRTLRGAKHELSLYWCQRWEWEFQRFLFLKFKSISFKWNCSAIIICASAKYLFWKIHYDIDMSSSLRFQSCINLFFDPFFKYGSDFFPCFCQFWWIRTLGGVHIHAVRCPIDENHIIGWLENEIIKKTYESASAQCNNVKGGIFRITYIDTFGDDS